MFKRPGPFSFGLNSTNQLITLAEPLQRVLLKAVESYDFSITEGRRTLDTQIRNIRRGASKTIDSRHIPRDAQGMYDPRGLSEAADLVPYQKNVNPWPQEGDTSDEKAKKYRRFYFMQGILYQAAHDVGVDVRIGVDWDGDLDFFDQTFDDMGHVELRTERADLKIPDDRIDEVNEALKSQGLPTVKKTRRAGGRSR
jgi:peptidoglycan L-alanyl-D-glutamate endopeptidase CwlK